MTGLLAASRAPDPFEAPGLEIFETPCLAEWNAFGVQFCLNRTMLYMFIGSALVIALFVVAARRRSLVPRGVRNVVESIIDFVQEQIALPVIGEEGRPWVPFLTSLFTFILVNNITGIIPGVQFPVTSRIAIPAFLAALVWVLFVTVGFRYQGLGYVKNVLFPPGVPKAIYVLLTPIEFVSTFMVRPLTLTVRLMANMTAGHLILTIFFLGTAYLLLAPPFVFGAASFALGTALVGFEILVAVLQAYIFT
ncbi:MAG: F0F1 ATP synthase subunit A, partial [Actinomycetota bacterium]